MLTIDLIDEAATEQWARRLAHALRALHPSSIFVTLSGELGAGKTTWVRALLRALGVTDPVRSPTYSLLESYPVGECSLDHMDWYRLHSEAELEGVGFRELLSAGHWLMVEWPERIPSVAQWADLALDLTYQGEGRRVTLTAHSEVAVALLARLSAPKT